MKKKLCILLFVCCIISVSQQTSAQTNVKATLTACDTIIRKYSNYKEIMDQFLEKICKDNKNNPEIFTGLAKSYYSYHTKDSIEAYKYIRKALSINSKYVPAYIAGGAIQDSLYRKYNDEDGRKAALDWYQRAIDANPKDTLGYEAYAGLLKKTDPDAAATKIMSITNYAPDFQAAIYVAYMYMKMDSIDKAINYFNQVDLNKMTQNILYTYAKLTYLRKQYEKTLEIATFGLEKYPNDLKMLRYTFYGYLGIKKYKQALTYAEDLFKKMDKKDIENDDYLNYGITLTSTAQYEKSIEMLEKYVNISKEKNNVIFILSLISSNYESLDNYDKAVETYQKIIDIEISDKSIKEKRFDEMVGIYLRQAKLQNGDEKISTINNAINKYHSMAMIPENTYYKTDLLYKGMELSRDIDTKLDKGIVKGKAEEIVTVINSMPMDDNNKQILPIAYHYLCYIAFAINHNMLLARTYARKYLTYSKADNLIKVVLKMK